MTGDRGVEEADIEEEIRRELEALNDWEIKDTEYETQSTDLSTGTSPSNSKECDNIPTDSVNTYIRLLQSRNTKLEDDLIEAQNALHPSNHPTVKKFENIDGTNEDITEKLKEKILTEIEQHERNNESSGKQYDADDQISSMEQMGLVKLKELERKQQATCDRLENTFKEIKDEELLRRQREETIRKENQRKADEEYKMKIKENQTIKLKLEEEAKSKQKMLKDLEKQLEVELKDMEKRQEREWLALQQIKVLVETVTKDEEIKKQKLQREVACITIQKNYRRFRVISKYGDALKIKREERQKRRQEELDALEKKEIQLMEDAIRKAREEEEEERLKEMEMEKEKKRQAEERRRQETELRKKLAIEKKKKDEAEKRRREEERKKQEEEAEEKKKRAEEEKRRQEEKRRKAEDERKKRHEQERERAEEERKKREIEEKARKAEQERTKLEEQKNKLGESRKNEEDTKREEEVNQLDQSASEVLLKSFKGDIKGQDDSCNDKSCNVTDSNGKLTAESAGNLTITDTTTTTANNYATKSDDNLPLRKYSIGRLNGKTADGNISQMETCERIPVRAKEEAKMHHNRHEVRSKDRFEDETASAHKSEISSQTFAEPGGALSELCAALEIRRAEWLKRTILWSSMTAEEGKVTKSRSRSRRPFSASQKLTSVSEEELVKSTNKFASFEKVVHVNLKDLPGRNLKIMLKCPNIKSAAVRNCGLLAAENFDNCKELKELNLSDNCIQNVSCQNIESLEHLDFSNNQLTSIHGLDGCCSLRSLRLAGNKITRIGSFSSNKLMHLSLQNNQLITTKGLSQMKYLQTLDCSNNFLSQAAELESCPLLGVLKLQGNNLQKPPVLSNHVMLREVRLSENSISSLEILAAQWLPLLQNLYVDNNSLSSLSPLQSLPMLETLDLRNNLLSDEDNLIPGLIGCHRLKNLCIHGNPVCEDSNVRNAILKTLPGLSTLDEEEIQLNNKACAEKTVLFSMCLSQIHAQEDMLARHKLETGNLQCESEDDEDDKDGNVVRRLTLQSRQLKEWQDLIIKHRVQHENVPDFEQKNLGDELTGKNLDALPDVLSKSSTRPTVVYQKDDEILMEEHEGKIGADRDDLDLSNADETPSQYENAKHQKYSKDELALKRKAAKPDLVTDSSQGCSKREDDNHADGMLSGRHHQAATLIQAHFRGFRMRKRYLEATKFARYPGIDLGDEEFNFDEEVDLSMFDVDEDALDNNWTPTNSPQFSPSNPPHDYSPPNEQKRFNPATKEDIYRPSPPRQAWRSPDSLVSQLKTRRVIPPIDTTMVISEQTSFSENTTERSHRTSELSSEWGFSKDTTAELMLKRAKKMKYNALRKKKFEDPEKRLERFKKAEEANKTRYKHVIQKKKEKQRIDYFSARDVVYQQPSGQNISLRDEEEKAKKEMTYSWVYNQAIVHKDKSDDILHDTKGYLTESRPVKSRPERSPPVSLPRMDPVILAGQHLPLVASPVGNPRPSTNSSDQDSNLKHSWCQEKTHSNPDLSRVGRNKVYPKKDKSNSADAGIMRERNNYF